MTRGSVGLILATALLATPGMASAGPSDVSIDTVGGQPVQDGSVRNPLSGPVQVSGTAAPGTGDGDQSQAQPLVADAGDSSFVAVGEPAVLLGAGYGGAEPYSFSWSSETGRIEGADAATAQLDTTGMAPGTHDVRLRITDAAGAAATDTVRVVVYEVTRSTLLDQTKTDAAPGTTVTGETVEFPFDVPAGTTRLTVDLTWGIEVNDYDLRVLDPQGRVAASSGHAPP